MSIRHATWSVVAALAVIGCAEESSTDSKHQNTEVSGTCGNGVVEGDEECDSEDRDECTEDCTLPCESEPPIEVCDCKVTGGGFIFKGEGARNDKITFGLVAMTNPGQGVHGNIEVVDHTTDTDYHGRVSAISCDGNTVTFSGSLDGGGTFETVVTDNGEPGRDDSFDFTTSGGFAQSGILGDGGPGGGNIQVHRSRCELVAVD